MTLAQIVTSIGDLFSAGMTWLQTVAASIFGGTIGTGDAAVTYTAQPLLMIGIIVAFVGLGIGFFKRILN